MFMFLSIYNGHHAFNMPITLSVNLFRRVATRKGGGAFAAGFFS